MSECNQERYDIIFINDHSPSYEYVDFTYVMPPFSIEVEYKTRVASIDRQVRMSCYRDDILSIINNLKVGSEFILIDKFMDKKTHVLQNYVTLITVTNIEERFTSDVGRYWYDIYCETVPNFLISDRLFRQVIAFYKRQTTPYLDRIFDNKQICANIDKTIALFFGLESGDDMLPSITRVIINKPGVVVFWSDDTKTVGKCIDGETFNPEVGLAMAISRKYYELVGAENPRAAFKNQLKNAEDQTKKTEDRRARKEKK